MHDCSGSASASSRLRAGAAADGAACRFRSSAAEPLALLRCQPPHHISICLALPARARAMASAIFSTPKIKYAINGVDAQFAAPPSVVENQGGARGFALSISSVTARLPASSPSLPGADSVRGRITYSFFDEVGRRFFGRTHVSQAVGVTLTAAAGGSVDVSLRLPTGGEVAYAWTRFVALSSRNPAHTRARA